MFPSIGKTLLPLLASTAQIPMSLPFDAPNATTFQLNAGPNVLSPDAMLQLPRPSAGVANPAGTLAFIPVTKHSLADKTVSKKNYVASLTNVVSSESLPTLEGGQLIWLDSATIGHFVPKDDDLNLFAVTVSESSGSSVPELGEPVLVGALPNAAEPTNFQYDEETQTLIFSATVFDDVDVKTVKKQAEEWKNRGSTALVYDKLYVRHWDAYRQPTHSSIFTAGLKKDDSGKWALSEDIQAPLRGTGHAAPVEPFGGVDDFDIAPAGIVYTAKDPETRNPAAHTRQDIYLIDNKSASTPRRLTTGTQGATKNPVFSPNGRKVAWAEMAEDGYESDQNFITIYDLNVNVRYQLDFQENGRKWDRSPDELKWSTDGRYLFFTAGDEGRVKIFTAPIPSTPKPAPNAGSKTLILSGPIPISLTHEHASSGLQVLPDEGTGRLLFSQNSLTSPNKLFLIEGFKHPERALKVTKVADFTEHLSASASTAADKSIALNEYEEIWFEGAEGVQVHGWVVKPYGWKAGDKAKTWPALLLIHGGPQGAWEDQWSTRWNPQVFASQGYFAIAINPTGSTTYGQAFTDAIAENWGGRPYVDLKKGWDHVLNKYPEIDPERAGAAGGSYGGYAVNWIAGHPEFGFNFKALFSHDGIFDTRAAGYTTEELFFHIHEFGGTPYSKKGIENAEKWNPRNHVDKFSVPQLIVHGSKDYRLAETEGLAMFTALQLRHVPSKLVIFPDENHWVLNPSNSLEWHTQVFEWFNTYVGAGKRE